MMTQNADKKREQIQMFCIDNQMNLFDMQEKETFYGT